MLKKKRQKSLNAMNSGRFVGHKGNKQWIWLSIDRQQELL